VGLTDLRYLGLAGTKIDNDSVAALCGALRQLEELDLSCCAKVDSDALLFLQGPPAAFACLVAMQPLTEPYAHAAVRAVSHRVATSARAAPERNRRE